MELTEPIESDLKKFIKQYTEINEQIKELKNEKEELRTVILTTIKVYDLEKYDTGTEICVLNTSKRKSFNKEKAIEFLVTQKQDVEDYFTESDFEVLKIKRKEVNEND